MSYEVDMLDSAIRHQQTMLEIKIRSFPGCAIESLPHEIPVVGMKSLQYRCQCWLSRPIVLKDFVGFFRPVNFSAQNIPAETSGRADALPFSQKSLAAQQIRIEPCILQ